MAKITEIADGMKPVKLKDLRAIDTDMTELSSMMDGMIRASTGLSEKVVENMPPGDKRLLSDTLGILQAEPYNHPEPEWNDEEDCMVVTLAHPLPNYQVVAVRVTGLGAVKDGMNSVTAIIRLLSQATNISSPALILELDMGDVGRILEIALPADLTDNEY